jgi:peptidoglycan/LPS O-acetylase OafA/YrhL
VRIPQLDGLRGLAILMVFLYHAFSIPLLWSGVDLFFVLSGYLITGILLRLKPIRGPGGLRASGKAWRTFYARRVRRILPPYLCFVIVIAAVYSIRWGEVWYFYAFFGANYANLLHRVPLPAMVPLWSLAVEEQFYLVWPLVVFCVSTTTLKRIAIFVIVAAPAFRIIFTLLGASHDAIYYMAPFRVDTLAWGAFIALQGNAWVVARRALALRVAVIAASILSVLSISASFRLTANSLSFNALGYSLVALGFAAMLVFALATHKGFIHSVLTAKTLRYLGLISYTFYLYHQAVFVELRSHALSPLLVALFGFAITALIAAVSWYALEAPILGLQRGLPGSPRRERQVTA